MAPATMRNIWRLIALSFSPIGVYCLFAAASGEAQTTGVDAGKVKSPITTTPAPHTPPPTAAETASTPQGKAWYKAETTNSDNHTGISTWHNWTYMRGDTIISGATARYNRKTDTLDTDDPIVMDDSKHHLTADKAHVEHAQKDPSLRVVVLTGHAVMVLKPETSQAAGEVPPAPVQAPGSPAAGNLKVVSISAQPPGSAPPDPSKGEAPPVDTRTHNAKPPTEDKDREDAKQQQRHGGMITCDKIEYKTAKKFATLTGHFVFKQNFQDKDGKQVERTMTCEHAENDGKANLLHLFKPIHFEDNDGQKGDSSEDAFVGTKEGEETLKLGLTTVLVTSHDEDEESDKPADTKTKDTNPKETKHSTDQGTKKTSQ